MIREIRNKEKLLQYYDKFITSGTLDHNVHPWIAASWEKSLKLGVPHDSTSQIKRLKNVDLYERRQLHVQAIEYLGSLYEQSREHLSAHNISLLLLDNQDYVLKNYTTPFLFHFIGDVEGFRWDFKSIGTSSIELCKEFRIPFLTFGPEMWLKSAHTYDTCSAPVYIDGTLRYVLSLYCVNRQEIPYEMAIAFLINAKHALESYLATQEYIAALHVALDELPQAVIYLKNVDQVLYANQQAKLRIGESKKLSSVFTNYEHLPVAKGFEGISCRNKEVTWLGPDTTYEDLTSVLPVTNVDNTTKVVVVTSTVEELKTAIAHASSHTGRYSLYNMVGAHPEFLRVKRRAARLARQGGHLLLQGEPGTGKQRMAYGIHQSGPRAAAPLIVVKCRGSEQALTEELFGNEANLPSKVMLARDSTLFIDEIEKMPAYIGDRLAAMLTDPERKLNVRLIAACDSSLRKLTRKRLFSSPLYELLMRRAPIKILPLRKRTADIALIAQHILSEMSNQYNLPMKTFSKEALTQLKSCPWPGNVKQLQEAVEQSFFHTPGTLVTPESIKIPTSKAVSKTWKQDKDLFVSLWKAAGGNLSRLAEMLSVSRVTLYRYLDKFELGRQRDF